MRRYFVGLAVVIGALVTASGANAAATWQVQSVPLPTGAAGGTLSAVSCSGTVCEAVGSVTNAAGSAFPLAERWNGNRWSVQSTPSPAGATGATFDAVSCASPTTCTAVGSFTDSSGVGVTLAERFSGSSWSIEITPNPPGAVSSELSAVSCATTAACTAVGSDSSGGGGMTLAESWGRARWSIETTPNMSGNDHLVGVSCSAATACIAVGSGLTTLVATLAERWDGTSWSITPTTPAGGPENFLNSVSCTSATSCQSVGQVWLDMVDTVTLGERWHAGIWSAETTPDPSQGEKDNALNGVSCTTANVCTAVGAAFTPNVPLAESYTGGVWSVQPTPDPVGATDSSLDGVSCASNAVCMAVGSEYGSLGAALPLAESYS